jgi:hypothetical protein
VQKNKSKKHFCQSNYDDLPLASVLFLGFFLVELLLFYGAKGDIMAPATIFLSLL